jgi:hypothetical protein
MAMMIILESGGETGKVFCPGRRRSGEGHKDEDDVEVEWGKEKVRQLTERKKTKKKNHPHSHFSHSQR